MPLRSVEIHYLRPPGRAEIFRQQLLHDGERVKVTLARDLALRRPVHVDGAAILESGSDVVWFTFPGAWHDIGRFHLADGTFTGIYANVLTPPLFEAGDIWRTTDLFLDLWLSEDGGPRVLDRDEFDEAVAAGWIDAPKRLRALEEVDALLEAAAAGRWPPAIVQEWTLERARTVGSGADSGVR